MAAVDRIVLGAGASGVAAARVLVARGHRVLLWDEGGEPPAGAWATRCGPLEADLLREVGHVVVSPGVDVAHHAVLGGLHGLVVEGEVALAAHGLDWPVVGITGTNGKSTVTHFTGALLRASLPGRTFVGGNLGEPLSQAVVEGGWARGVVELSSYQLERAGTLAPRVSVVLNLTPDHLARHETMDGYADAKLRIIANAGPDDLLFLPSGDAEGGALLRRRDPGGGRRAWLGAHPGVVRDGLRAHLCWDGVDVTLDLSAVRVPGPHNLDHAATSAALAIAFGAPADAVQEALAGLTGLPHRMQTVHEAGGVRWIDDSKATNPDAARVAIDGVEGCAVVLLGGISEGADVGALAPLLARHRAIGCFGRDGSTIAASLRARGLDPVCVDTLADAVTWARAVAQPGDAVLLSPACKSFDAFRSYAHRGEVFAVLAREEVP